MIWWALKNWKLVAILLVAAAIAGYVGLLKYDLAAAARDLATAKTTITKTRADRDKALTANEVLRASYTLVLDQNERYQASISSVTNEIRQLRQAQTTMTRRIIDDVRKNSPTPPGCADVNPAWDLFFAERQRMRGAAPVGGRRNESGSPAGGNGDPTALRPAGPVPQSAP